MNGNKINTSLSVLVSALEEKQGIKLSEAAQTLELTEHETEKLAKMLAECKILEIHYSLKGQKILKKGAWTAKTREMQGTLHKKKQVSAETERVINYMRQKIAERRNSLTEENSIGETQINPAVNDETERQKRLKEIKEGLNASRENLEKIKNSLEDLRDKQESFNPQAEPVITDSQVL